MSCGISTLTDGVQLLKDSGITTRFFSINSKMIDYGKD